MLVSVLKWCFLFESCHQRDTSFSPVQQDTSLTHEPLGSNPFEKTPSWEFVFQWMNLVKTQPIMVSAHIPSFCSQYLCEQTFRARKIQSGDCQSLPGVAGVCVCNLGPHFSNQENNLSDSIRASFWSKPSIFWYQTLLSIGLWICPPLKGTVLGLNKFSSSWGPHTSFLPSLKQSCPCKPNVPSVYCSYFLTLGLGHHCVVISDWAPSYDWFYFYF